MKKIVVTGATSMIGMALLNQALDANKEVLAIIRPNSSRRVYLPQHRNLTVLECEMKDYDTLNLDEKYDVLYHLAWAKTASTQRNTIDDQILNLQYEISAVRLGHRLRCHSFVGVGSQAEFGKHETGVPTPPDAPINPENGYGIAKYAGGKLSRLECESLGMRHFWGRIFSTYGEGDQLYTLVMHCINSFLQGKSPELTKCDQIWDYIYSKDMGRALIAIGEHGKDGSVYCIGTGQCRPLKDYVADIRDAIGSDIEIKFGIRDYYQNQVMYLCADISPLTVDTGFMPEYSFKEGIKNTIEWCRKYPQVIK